MDLLWNGPSPFLQPVSSGAGSVTFSAMDKIV